MPGACSWRRSGGDGSSARPRAGEHSPTHSPRCSLVFGGDGASARPRARVPCFAYCSCAMHSQYLVHIRYTSSIHVYLRSMRCAPPAVHGPYSAGTRLMVHILLVRACCAGRGPALSSSRVAAAGRAGPCKIVFHFVRPLLCRRSELARVVASASPRQAVREVDERRS